MFFLYKKYRNIPLRQLSEAESAEVDKKAQEIERGVVTEDVDEDDAGKKKKI